MPVFKEVPGELTSRNNVSNVISVKLPATNYSNTHTPLEEFLLRVARLQKPCSYLMMSACNDAANTQEPSFYH